MAEIPAGWVPLVGLSRTSLPAATKAALMAVAMEELATAQALVMIHGQAEGIRLYVALGGCARFDEDDNVLLPVAAASRAGKL